MNRKENNPQTTYDIYVGNVPKNITDTELKQVFVKYGEIKQVLCRWKEEHAAIGYAIVKFVFKADADKLLQETNEVLWNGHSLPVKAARRSDQNQHNGNQLAENKSNAYPDFNSKPMYMNPPFLKGPPTRMFMPIPPPFPKPAKRPPNDYHFMPDAVYFPNSNCHENQNAHTVPLNLEVLCTNVEDAITFYGCPVQRFEELMNISQALTNLNLTPHKGERKPLCKRVYAGLFSEDQSWYRCIVTRASIPNKPGMCSVSYIDYGNQEDIPCRNIVELPETLQKIPPFASRFIFSNLTCESKSNKQTYLHQLTNKRMSLCAILSPVNSEYQVLKCSCNGKDVISETVKKGFASFKKAATKPGSSKQSSSANKTSHKSINENIENRKSKTSVCNGVNGHAVETQENGFPTEGCNNIKIARKPTPKVKDNCKTDIRRDENSNNDNGEDVDFHPKMIIKRGSDLSHIVGSKEFLEDKKEKDVVKQQISSSTMDSVISNLKLINNIRTLVSQSSDDSIIQRAVELLQNENLMLEIPENQVTCIDEAFEKYNLAMNEIKKCKDRANLLSLKEQRDLFRKELCEKLKDFIQNFNTSILTRKEEILKTIMDLASNSNDWMNVELKTKPSSLQELVVEYNKVKENKWNLVRKARDMTNERHKQFMEIFKNLEKELHLNSCEKDNFKCDSLDISNETKRTSYSLKFEEALKSLGEAVDEEIRTLTLNKGKDSVSIIQCLLAELDVHKEKVETICEMYEAKLHLFNDVCRIVDSEKFLTELSAIQEEICSALLQLTHCKDSIENSRNNFPSNICELLSHDTDIEETSLDTNPELCSVIRNLHIALLKEDKVIESLAKASEMFPELCIEHPELKLKEYLLTDFLLKFNWKPDYFLNLEKHPKEKSFVSRLLDNPIIIKEYKHETREDMEKFIQIAVVWNRCKCEYLLKIQALFFREDNSIYAICPYVSGSLLKNPPVPIPVEGEKSCSILRQLLICLKELHAQKLIYGAVHPSSILIENDKIVLDFCFNPGVLTENIVLKGINFHPPSEEVSEKSGDMYGFGCMVLWLLFPNLSFTSTEEGVPNVAAFRSIIEEALTPKDYTLLCSLLSSRPMARPSASFLLSKNFLSNYESYCRARNKAMSSS